jgi:hypothetical protein
MDPRGITVVVLTYERPTALATLLRALLEQSLGGLSLELILCNNSARLPLDATAATEVGRLLSEFPDRKILTSSHNWLCRIRYTLATLARYETIFFIDDDLSPADPRFVRDLYDALGKLRRVDIVSCWTTLWTEWNDRFLTKVRMGFTKPDPCELTECDTVGPGICMFDKSILFHREILDPPPERLRSDSGWFPFVTAMEFGSRKFYLPSHGRLRIHEERRLGALSGALGFQAELHAAYKQMWKRGYRPVLDRARGAPAARDSPEMRAARSLEPLTDYW